MKKQIILTAVVCAVVLIAASVLTGFWKKAQKS